MSENEEFRKLVEKLMNESGYQAYAYGKQNTPVQQAVWPDTSLGGQAQQDAANQVNVTDGSTTELGAPRADLQAQENGGESSLDPEVMGEVASLLISIGFVLQSAGIVTDKYDTAGITSFLTDNFSQLSMGNPTDDIEVDIEGGQVDPSAPQQPPVAPTPVPTSNQPIEEKRSPYMESRKLLESRFKNITKKK
jgi:hypothetical protein